MGEKGNLGKGKKLIGIWEIGEKRNIRKREKGKLEKKEIGKRETGKLEKWGNRKKGIRGNLEKWKKGIRQLGNLGN